MTSNKIHIAFGFHVNCYHSYRGDTPDAQGFGTLGVRTPGLFGGYLDEGFGRRSNDYFLTGDEAALFRERLYLR